MIFNGFFLYNTYFRKKKTLLNKIVSLFRTLYDIQVAADRALSRKRLDFAGRLCTPHGKIAKLYPNLKINDGVYQDQDNPQFST